MVCGKILNEVKLHFFIYALLIVLEKTINVITLSK